MIAFPLVYSVYTGIAEAARDLAVAQASKRRDPGVELVGALDTELASTRIACDSLVAFSETATPGPETTNTVFVHRSLIARSALRTVDLAMDVAGGAAYFRQVGLERLFRDIQGARFHPLTDGAQRRLAGRTALGLPIGRLTNFRPDISSRDATPPRCANNVAAHSLFSRRRSLRLQSLNVR